MYQNNLTWVRAALEENDTPGPNSVAVHLTAQYYTGRGIDLRTGQIDSADVWQTYDVVVWTVTERVHG